MNEEFLLEENDYEARKISELFEIDSRRYSRALTDEQEALRG